MTAGIGGARLDRARVEGESALVRLVRLNPPGKVSLAGAYALGYAALGMAQRDEDAGEDWQDEDWFDLLDPLDALVLGAVFPQRFTDVYQFSNTRDAWLRLLRDTVHWRGIETIVHLIVRTSQEFDRPVDDGELMLIVAGKVEAAKLDQRKLPRAFARRRTGGLPYRARHHRPHAGRCAGCGGAGGPVLAINQSRP